MLNFFDTPNIRWKNQNDQPLCSTNSAHFWPWPKFGSTWQSSQLKQVLLYTQYIFQPLNVAITHFKRMLAGGWGNTTIWLNQITYIPKMECSGLSRDKSPWLNLHQRLILAFMESSRVLKYIFRWPPISDSPKSLRRRPHTISTLKINGWMAGCSRNDCWEMVPIKYGRVGSPAIKFQWCSIWFCSLLQRCFAASAFIIVSKSI